MITVHNDSPWIKGNEPELSCIFKQNKIGKSKFYGLGEIIYLQDDVSNSFYYVKQGRVKVYILQEDGTEKILSIHEPGSFFGETSAIDQLPRPCCASAMVESEIIVLLPDDLIKLIQLDVNIAKTILSSLSRKIRMLSYQIKGMAFLEAEQRICHMLLKLAADFGSQTENGVKLSIRFTDQQLAGLVGTCRVTVTKSLNLLKKEGLIDKKNRNIIIKDRIGLLKHLYLNEEDYINKFKKTI